MTTTSRCALLQGARRDHRGEAADVPKNFRLLPGDTLTGDVMVGERTIMSYLQEGILRTTSQAMREP